MPALTNRVPRTAEELGACLRDARQRTLALVHDLEGERLFPPRLATVNPILWELGHVAWFQERWTLRHLGGRAPLSAGSDALYDSARVEHAARWDLPLPARAEALASVQRVLDAVLERLERVDLGPRELYFHRLVLYHEDMHAEALVYTRQTLGYPAPPAPADAPAAGGASPGDVELPAGRFLMGAAPGAPFAFDNELPAREVAVAAFRLARTPVTQAEFVAFVEDGGYRRRELWSPAGWSWREALGAEHPVYWRRDGGAGWERRAYDRWVPLEEHQPVFHVAWYEAEAWCRWAGRRLLTEAEWEYAAREPADVSAHGLQTIGNVWEWTADPFLPYPGFEPGPYREYSAPWYGTHKALRGGSFATPTRLTWPSFRNFFTPDRRDVLAGFRTAAVEDDGRQDAVCANA